MKPDTLVINTISLLSKLTGIGRYTLEICKRIAEKSSDFDVTYFYGYYSKTLYMTDIAPSGKLAKQVKNFLGKYYLIKKATRESLLLMSRFSHKKFDLYWEPNISPIVHIKSKKLITTVHDFSFARYPECLPKENKEYLQKHFWRNIHKSDRIIADSHFIKEEIIDQLKYDPARITVIHLGIDHDNFKVYDRPLLRDFAVAQGIPDKFILFVGSIEPRKNLKNALLAYQSLPEAFKKEYKFVLAGFSGWKNAEVMDIIRRDSANILYLGYLTNLDLAYVYNNASAFLYTPLYEGFGLPPLEAMACGTPVIVSRTSSLPEVCEDSAFYVDPHSIESIAHGIYKVVSDNELRNSLTKKGIERARVFNWESSVNSHLSLFNEVLHQ